MIHHRQNNLRDDKFILEAAKRLSPKSVPPEDFLLFPEDFLAAAAVLDITFLFRDLRYEWSVFHIAPSSALTDTYPLVKLHDFMHQHAALSLITGSGGHYKMELR
jgi:hypothetical protein